MHHAVEVRSGLVAHSMAKLRDVGLTGIQVHHGDVYAIDRAASMRFDRIWVGAGASHEDRALVVELLKGTRALQPQPAGLPA